LAITSVKIQKMEIILSPLQTIIVPIIIGVVQGIKELKIKYVSDSRFAFLYAILLGIGGFFILEGTIDATVIFNGVVAGLASAGLYSGTKSLVGK